MRKSIGYPLDLIILDGYDVVSYAHGISKPVEHAVIIRDLTDSPLLGIANGILRRPLIIVPTIFHFTENQVFPMPCN